MGNEDFEQQFTQNVRATVAPVMSATSITPGASKLTLVISITLAAIVLVESIVLLITLSNYFSAVNNLFVVDDDVALEEGDFANDDTYIYDENINLVAMDITCSTESGDKIILTKNNKIEQYSSNGSLISSGNYSIINNSIVSVTGSSNDRTLYYDGFILADDITIYECEDGLNETTAE